MEFCSCSSWSTQSLVAGGGLETGAMTNSCRWTLEGEGGEDHSLSDSWGQDGRGRTPHFLLPVPGSVYYRLS